MISKSRYLRPKCSSRCFVAVRRGLPSPVNTMVAHLNDRRFLLRCIYMRHSSKSYRVLPLKMPITKTTYGKQSCEIGFAYPTTVSPLRRITRAHG